MAMDFIGLSVGMGYTEETVIGGGALKGKNCVVSNIEEVADGVKVTFQWTLDDGTVQIETVLLPKGAQGEAGVDGKSAYEIWLEAGNTGTEEDFLISLVGEKGDDGKSAYQYAQDGGYIGTETEFTTNIARSGVISKELEVERARIDNLTTLQDGSTTGDAELIDARIDFLGSIHNNVGEHIRNVTRKINSDLTNNLNLTQTNKSIIDSYFSYTTPSISGRKFYVYDLVDELTQFIFDLTSFSNLPSLGKLRIGYVATYNGTAIKDRICLKSNTTLPIYGNNLETIIYNQTDGIINDNQETLSYVEGNVSLNKYIGCVISKVSNTNALILNGGKFGIVSAELITDTNTYDLMDYFIKDSVSNAWTGANTLEYATKQFKYFVENLKQNNSQKYEGANMCVIGDSISVGYTMVRDYNNNLVSSVVSKKWWEIIKERYSLSNVQNISEIGACFTIDGTVNNPRFTSRLSDISGNPEIIVVFGGTNDYERNRIIGSLTDTPSSDNDVSFVSAVKYTMEYLTTNYPDSKIIYITPLQRNYTQGFNKANANGFYLYEYIDVIKKLGYIYGVIIDDLYELSEFHMASTDFIAKYCGDGLHPNTEGTQLYTANGIIPVFDRVLK